jgi:hypothetical protein
MVAVCHAGVRVTSGYRALFEVGVRMILRTAALVGLLLSGGGCMYTPEGKPPQDIWLVNAPMDEAVSCIASGMDAAMINKINRSNDVKHQFKVIVAGSLYEITAAEGSPNRYVVQLIKVDNSTTKVLLQSPPGWNLLSVAVEHCDDARKFIRYGS